MLRSSDHSFDVFPDGERFLINRMVTETDEKSLVLVQGWQREANPDDRLHPRPLPHLRAARPGGMGDVWRATDAKLGREVALKVLPSEFADDLERLERFEREARAMAALNHPNIVTIYTVEEADGIHFLTMELVEGPSSSG